MTACRALVPDAAWAVYLAAGTVLCGLYLAVPPFKGSGPLMNLIGLSPVLAILAAIRRHRPASRLPWYLLAAGSALFWLGDLYTYSYPHLLGGDVPFPSPGDALYVAMYPVMMAGLLLLVRRRAAGTDRNGLVDGLILTVGLVAPVVDRADGALPAPGRPVTARQDRLGRLPDRRRDPDRRRRAPGARLAAAASRAFHLLTASIALLLVTDFAYGLLTLHGLLRPPAVARRGLDRLLPALGRGRPAPVDGAARSAGAGPRGRAHATSASAC